MIYLAAPFFNEEQLDMVKRLENAFEENALEYFSPRSEGVLIDMNPEEKELYMEKIFDSNVRHIEESSIIVAVIDNYDTGTVWEMGFGYALNVPIFTISDKDYGLNVMIRQSVTCHNTSINHLMTNIKEYYEDDIITVFNELTKDVT